MREIKFRQPLFYKGKFSQWHYWGILSDSEFVAPTNQVDTWKKSQQYTGLKDKNDKEIYEGDILKGRYYVAEIKYQGGAFGLYWQEGEIKQHASITVLVVHQSVYEIIGNIYENKELLCED